jgi:hypothetical protein
MKKNAVKSRCEWLERYWIVGPYLCLCLNEKDYQNKLDDIKIPKEQRAQFVCEGKDAQVHICENSDKELVCIVTLLGYESHSVCEIFATLAHEAMHIWREKLIRINETKPSSEFEAYSIQSICLRLFCSFTEQTGRKILMDKPFKRIKSK